MIITVQVVVVSSEQIKLVQLGFEFANFKILFLEFQLEFLLQISVPLIHFCLFSLEFFEDSLCLQLLKFELGNLFV